MIAHNRAISTVEQLSYEDWLNGKSDESAHNEIMAFLMVILGMNISIGGLIVTIIMLGQPNIFLFMTQQPISMSAALGPILTIVGFLLTSAGFILVVYYDRKRSWYMGEIHKASMFEKKKSKSKAVDPILEPYVREEEGQNKAA
jgi:hypothetical protein